MAGSVYPKGLLSFLYNVIYNKEINDEYEDNPQKVMRRFALSEKEQEAVKEYNYDDLDDIMNLLQAELEKDRPIVW